MRNVFSRFSELFQKILHMHSLDIPQLPFAEMILQNSEGVLVALLGGRRDVVLVAFEPGIRPLLKT